MTAPTLDRPRRKPGPKRKVHDGLYEYDDVVLDVPDDEYVDEVSVDHAVAGLVPWKKLNKPERAEAVRRLLGPHNMTLSGAAARLHTNVRSIEPVAHTLGLLERALKAARDLGAPVRRRPLPTA